jgi:hypothetical protein
VIQDDVWIGASCIIRRGVTIGTGAVIGANSFVNQDVPPFAIMAGSPARNIGARFDDQTAAKILASKWWELPGRGAHPHRTTYARNLVMIVSRLIGGLGNQMFQYAAGRALACAVVFAIDSRAFADYKTHAFGMQCFCADLTEAPARLIPNPPAEGRLQRLLRRFLPSPLRVYTEKTFTFDNAVLSLPDGTYLDGYWQSEKYFADFADQIRKDFAVKAAPSAPSQAWLELIDRTHSVSLHIRRGDYVSNAAAAAVHGTCDLGYYERAVAHLHQVTGQAPELFVFQMTWIGSQPTCSFLTRCTWCVTMTPPPTSKTCA